MWDDANQKSANTIEKLKQDKFKIWTHWHFVPFSDIYKINYFIRFGSRIQTLVVKMRQLLS